MEERNNYEEISFAGFNFTLSQGEKTVALGSIVLLIVCSVIFVVLSTVLFMKSVPTNEDETANKGNSVVEHDMNDKMNESADNSSDEKSFAGYTDHKQEQGSKDNDIVIDFRREFFDSVWNSRYEESKKQLALTKIGLVDFDVDGLNELIVLWGDEDGENRVEEVYEFSIGEKSIQNIFSTSVKKFNMDIYKDNKKGDSIGIVKSANGYEYVVHGDGYRLYRRKLEDDSTFGYQMSEKYTQLDGEVYSRAKNTPSSWSPDKVQLYDVTTQEADRIHSIVIADRMKASVEMQETWITASTDTEKAFAKWADCYNKLSGDNLGKKSSSSVRIERPLPDKGKWSMETVKSSKDKFSINGVFSGGFDFDGAGIDTHGTELTYLFDISFIENDKGGYVQIKTYAKEENVLGSNTYQVGLDGDSAFRITVDGQESWINLSSGNQGTLYVLDQEEYNTLLNCLLGGKDVECVLMAMPPITFKMKSDNFASVYDYALHKDEPYNPKQENNDSGKQKKHKYIYKKVYEKILDLNDLVEIANIDNADYPGGRSVNQMIINEIYARHGYVFGKNDLKEYFENKSWYIGETDSMNKIEKDLSEIEKNNITILRNADMTNSNATNFTQ